MIDCPDDIVTFSSDLTSLQESSPVVSNGVGAFTWSSDWPSNNAFPLGASIVTYTVTDQAGNMDTCTLTVTVLGKFDHS